MAQGADLTLEKLKENTFVLKAIKSKSEIDSAAEGFLIDAVEGEIRKIMDALKARGEKKIIAVLGRDDEFNRRVVEKCRIDYLVSPERGHTRDSLKQRDSGLNHVLAKAAAKNGIAIVIDYSALRGLGGKEKAQALARVMQNVGVCRRAKCSIKIATFARKKDELRDELQLRAFASSIGMSSEQSRDARMFKKKV